MKKLLWTVFILTAMFISCKKENGDTMHCYECDFSPVGYPGSSPGTYQDAGCMTNDQWETVAFGDASGNITLNKNSNCRRK